MTSITNTPNFPNDIFVGTGNEYDIYTLKRVAVNKDATTNSLDVNGNVNSTSKIIQNGNVLVPRGMIAIWSGIISSIPLGWTLCDGSNGTPDLRNRFIIGASVDSGNIAMTTITGSTTLTGGSKDAIVPAHTHTGVTNTTGSHSHTYLIIYYENWNPGLEVNGYGPAARGLRVWSNTFSAGSHTHTSTTSTDGNATSGTNANLPPYFALAYIMKL